MLGIYLFSRCIYIYQIYLSIWIYLFSWGSIWIWSWWWKWWCTLNLQDAPSASRWRSWRVWTWTSLPVPWKAAGFLGMFLVDGDLQKVDIWVTDHQGYPLVNIQKTMENHHFSMGKSTISMAIFNSYVSLPEGIWIGGLMSELANDGWSSVSLDIRGDRLLPAIMRTLSIERHT